MTLCTPSRRTFDRRGPERFAGVILLPADVWARLDRHCRRRQTCPSEIARRLLIEYDRQHLGDRLAG